MPMANPVNFGVASGSLTLPTIRYTSGKRTWYVTTLPYKTLGKLVQTSAVKKKNADIIPAEVTNRFLVPEHKNDIKRYIKQEEEFTIPPITLVSTEKLYFKPITFPGGPTEEELIDSQESIMGNIIIPLDYEFFCLDGNHRTVSIRELANEAPQYIEGSHMVLNIVHEIRKRKIRQDFVDVNKNAKATSSSINTFFNTRDALSNLVADLIEEHEYLKNTSELFSNSVSKNAKLIYTINNIKNAVIELSGNNSQTGNESKVTEFLKNAENHNEIRTNSNLFFNKLKENNHIAQCLSNYDTIPDIRVSSVITSGVGLLIAARLANRVFKNYEENDIESMLDNIMKFNWSRNNQIFEGNIIVPGTGKIATSREPVNFATEILVKVLGISS